MADPPTVDELLDRAVALPAEQRDAFLRDATEDGQLIREVESLLAVLPELGGFLETPPPLPPNVVRQLQDSVASTTGLQRDLSGERVGTYDLHRRLGAGGMGDVYLAERADGAFEKRVAIKLLRGDLRAGGLERRFRTERQALAGLEHPHIARLLDGGATDDGTPYLVMELVEDGVPLDDACRRSGASQTQRLRSFLAVCDAVQYAHSRLVVHRDLKPSNVLLDQSGQVKLVDFGIAKLLADSPETTSDPTGVSAGLPTATAPATATEETIPGARALTPAYASPEQLRGESGSIATDVYSLGLLLHVLLAERLPQRPVAEGRSAVEIPGDLGWIVRKALEDEPARRYPTVAHLAQDVERFLHQFPVEAAPASRRSRASKFLRRHRLAVAVAASVAATLVVATTISTFSFFVAERERREAERERASAERERASAEQVSDFLSSVLGSIDPNVAQGRDVSVLTEVIDGAAARIPSELADQPGVAARLHEVLGLAYQRLARYDDAEEQVQRALTLREELGESASGTLVQLASLSLDQSSHEQAEQAARDALTRAMERHGLASREYAEASLSFGKVAFQLGLDEGEQFQREAVDVARRLGEGHESLLAAALTELGWRYATDQQPDDAEPLLREALELRRRSAATAPLELAHSIERLAYALRIAGRYDESQTLYEEEVSLTQRLLGEEHPSYGLALSHLAALHGARGADEEALATYQRALAVQQLALGPHHREVGTTVNNLGGLLRQMGRFDEAAEHYQRAIQIYGEALGEDHVWIAIVRGNLAFTHFGSGDWQRAKDVFGAAIDESRQHWSPDYWRIVTFEGFRGAALFELGEEAKGEGLLLRSWRRLRADLGDDDRRTRQFADLLEGHYRDAGRTVELQRLLIGEDPRPDLGN